ncbi:hypothetical protein HK101_010942 [Irineochytrium annulatum]|nr:hypothetical protein HK101_010942 [Irineochytrium annulatum]
MHDGEVAWAELLQAVTSGDMRTLLLKRDERSSGKEWELLASLEALVLVMVFLAAHGNKDGCDAETTGKLFDDVLRGAREGSLGVIKASRLPAGVWARALGEGALRLEPGKDADGRWTGMTWANLEVTERARCAILREGLLGRVGLWSKEEMGQVGAALACGVSTVAEVGERLDSGAHGRPVVGTNLETLAPFIQDVPMAWISFAFVNAAADYVRGGLDAGQEKATEVAVGARTLASYLRRRRGPSTGVEEDAVFHTAAVALLNALEAMREWGYMADMASGWSMIGLSYAYVYESTERPRIFRGVIDMLRDRAARLPTELCRACTLALGALMAELDGNDLADVVKCSWTCWGDNTDDLAFNLSDVCRDVAVYRWDREEKGVKESEARNGWITRVYRGLRRKSKKVEMEPGWIRAMMGDGAEWEGSRKGLVAMRLMASAGVLTSVYASPVVGETVVETVEDRVFEGCLKAVEGRGELKANDVLGRSVAFASTHVMSALPAEVIGLMEHDLMPILQTLISVMLVDEKTLQLPTPLPTDRDELTTLASSLTTRSNQTTRHSLRREVPRMSRLAGTLLADAWAKGNRSGAASVVRYLRDHCRELGVAWGSSVLDVGDRTADAAVMDAGKAVLEEHKVVLFSVTMVIRSLLLAMVTDRPRGEEEEIVLVDAMAALAGMHHVTVRFGKDGFKAWADCIEAVIGVVERLRTEDKGAGERLVRGLVKVLLGVDIPYAFSSDLDINNDLKAATISAHVFLTTITKHLLRFLSDPLVNDAILPLHAHYLLVFHTDHAVSPRIHPNTRAITTPPPHAPLMPDLNAASHDLIVAVFERSNRFPATTVVWAPWYARGLLRASGEGDGIEEAVLRRGWSYAIKGLASITSPGGGRLLDREEGEDESGESGSLDDEDRGRVGRQEEPGAEEEVVVGGGDDGDGIAWVLIAELVDEIMRLSDLALEGGGASKPPVRVGAGGSRIDEILGAAPAAVGLHVHRDRLLTLLFDQIRTVGVRALPALLDAIRGLLLHGRPELGEHAEDAEEETGKASEGLGLAADPDVGEVWKALYKAVSFARGFDIVRRTGCVEWYLQVKSEALELWKSHRGAKNTLKKDAHTALLLEPSEAAVAVGSPLRAKL